VILYLSNAMHCTGQTESIFKMNFQLLIPCTRQFKEIFQSGDSYIN